MISDIQQSIFLFLYCSLLTLLFIIFKKETGFNDIPFKLDEFLPKMFMLRFPPPKKIPIVWLQLIAKHV